MNLSFRLSLFDRLVLPCGATLKNRIIKSAMSDQLGDGTGHPSHAQEALYRRWAEGGVAASIIGEVQGSGDFAESPGNLVLNAEADRSRFAALAAAGSENGAGLWLQLGHAGALAYQPTSRPKGPSALDLPGLTCGAFSEEEVAALPAHFAETARLGEAAGFGGVQIHAAHGFLLSQFLSPLFNRREDDYGGTIENRMRLLRAVVDAVRNAVSPGFVVAIKLNATDQLEGGFEEHDALAVIAMLDETDIDLIDISGGTYFPGARAASDSGGKGPYFIDFARMARRHTRKPLMATGGFKTLAQVCEAVESNAVDVVGLARALAIAPDLPSLWQAEKMAEPAFPRFSNPGEGDVTAWYTIRLAEIGADADAAAELTLEKARTIYRRRVDALTSTWKAKFQ